MPRAITEGIEEIRDTSYIGEEEAWNGLGALERGELTGEAAASMQSSLRSYKANMAERKQRYAFPTFEKERQEQEALYYRELFGNTERLRAVVDPERIKQVELEIGTSGENLDDALMDEAVFGFLQDRTGLDPKVLSENYEGVMEQYGRDVLGVEGIKTPKAFYGAMGAMYETGEKQEKLAGKISAIAIDAAAVLPDSEQGPMGVKGQSFQGLVSDWGQITGDADYDPKNAALYKQIYREKFEAAKKAYARVEPVADRILSMLEAAADENAKGESNFLSMGDTGIGGMVRAIQQELQDGGITADDAMKLQYLLARRMSDMSGEQRGTGANAKRSLGRGVDDILINLSTFAGRTYDYELSAVANPKPGERLYMNKDYSAPSNYPILMQERKGDADDDLRRLTDAETQAHVAQLQSGVSTRDLIQFLKNARESTDPIKPANEWIPDVVEVGLFDASRSVPYTAASFVPFGLGTFVTSASLSEDSYREILANDPNANRRSAGIAADLSGVAQGLTERFVDRAVFLGRSKNLSRVLDKMAIKNGVARFGAAVAVKSALEYSEEKIQDFENAAIVDIVAGISKDIPGTNWDRWSKSFFDAGGNLRTYMAVLPLALIASGKFSFEEIRDSQQMMQNEALLRTALGDDDAARRVAQESDPVKREELLRQEWQNRVADRSAEAARASQQPSTVVTQDSEGNAAEVAYSSGTGTVGYSVEDGVDGPQIVETKREGLMEMADDEEIFRSGMENGLLPGITRTEEGYKVAFPDDGGEVVVPALNDATALVGDWMDQRAERERVSALEWGQYLEDYHENQRLSDETDTEMTVGTMVEGNPLLLAQLEERAAIEGVPFDDRIRIFGSSEREMREKRAHYIARLYKGGNPLDVAEEFAEGFIKGSLRDGIHTVDEILAMMRQFEAASGTKVVKAVSTQGVIESFSDMARGYVAGNIDAEIIPPKMKAWFKSMVFFLQDVFRVTGQLMKFRNDVERGRAINETKAAGGLDPNFEGLLRQATGLDVASFERRMMAEQADMGGLMDEESEISNVVKGRLPRPSDMVGDPFHGELEQLWDGMRGEAKGRRVSDGRRKLTGAAANAFFAPPGQGMDLDALRNYANERGHTFETIDEMLVAIADSQAGNLQYGTATQFNEGELEQSFTIGPAEDAAYLDAVERGDEAAAAEIVRAAAEAAGFDTSRPMYHGGTAVDTITPQDFFTHDRQVAFLSSSREHAQHFAGEGGTVQEVWYQPGNQVEVGEFNNEYEALNGVDYDSVISRDIRDAGFTVDEVVITREDQAKSAATVVRDAAGNVVPLSQRFRSGDPRITFSTEGQEEQQRVFDESEAFWSGIMKTRRVFERMEAGEVVELAPAEELAAMKSRTYEVMSKGPTAQAARKAIKEAGSYANAVAMVLGDADSINPRVKIFAANMLRAMALEKQNYEIAAQISDRLAELGTEAGQVVEAFKYLGDGFSTPESAIAWVKRQIKKAKKGAEPAEAIDATKASIADVMKQANRLFNDWVNEALGVKNTKEKREAVKGYRMEDIPDVTFSLDSALNDLVPWAVRTMQDLGADAVDTLLVQKYGERIKPHLADVKIAALKKLKRPGPKKGKAKAEAPAAPASSRAPSGDPQTFENRRQGELGLPAEPQGRVPSGDPTTVEAREQADLGLTVEDFADHLTGKVLDQLKIRNIDTPRKAREAVDAILKQVTGAGLSADAVSKVIDTVYAEKYQLPTLTPEMVQRTTEFSQRIARTPEGSIARRQATIEFMDYVHDSMSGVDWLDIGWSVWYANILSGYNTHLRNLGDSGIQVAADSFLSAFTANPAQWGQNMAEMLAGMKDGLARGRAEAVRHVRTGEALVARETESKFGARGALERVTFAGGKANPFNWLKVVPRLLVAEDYLLYAGAMEAKARLIALEMARAEGLKDGAVSDRVQAILNLSPERMVEFSDRAAAEWQSMAPGDYTGTREEWMKRRVSELQVMERNAELFERSSDFAARATYNYKPEGFFGVLAEALGAGLHGIQNSQGLDTMGFAGKAVKGLSQGGKFLMPFVRIVANVLNKQLDYSPVGLLRAALPATTQWNGRVEVKQKSADVRAMELKKGMIGTLLIAGFLFRTPDDDDNLFEIHGAGPIDFGKANQLRATGWLPNSIQIGGKYISYKNSPLGALLAVLGNYYDAERYEGGHEGSGVLMRLAYGMTDAAQVVLDQSFLSNMSDFLTILSRKGEATTRAMERFLGRTLNPGNAVPFANLWKQASADLDSKLRDRVGIQAELASMVPVAELNEAKIDALGDEIAARPFGWFWSAEKEGSPEARIWRMVADKKAWFTNTYSYRNKMTPEQFRQYTIIRGGLIKEKLLANDARILRTMESATEEKAQDRMEKLCRDASDKAKKKVGYVDPNKAKK